MGLMLLPAIFFGWSLGANDASNIFGPAVSTGLVRFRTAAIVSALFILIGAVIGGSRGLETISSITDHSMLSAAVSALSAALAMTLMTRLGLPVSASQAMVGSILGIGILTGNVQWHVLVRVFLAWLGTPIGGLLFGFIGYHFFSVFFRKVRSLYIQDITLKIAAVVIGAYGAYALGANNVGNVTGVFAGIIPVEQAALIGGLSIGLGVVTYSKRVMLTVGKQILALDHFASVIAVLGMSFTVWVYSIVGVPVSTSQAIVGAVIGAGLARGSRVGDKRVLGRIALGWIQTPLIAGAVSASIYSLVRLIERL